MSEDATPPELRWITDGLAASGKSRKDLAKAMGRSPSMVTNLLNGSRQLKQREVSLIAAFLNVPPPPAPNIPSPYDDEDPQITRLDVIGEVAAGVWSDPDIDTFDRYQYDVPADPRFPAAKQFLLKVRGPSINRRAAHGSLVKCLDVFGAPRAPRDGDWVVARRMRNGTAETTVKRLKVEPDGRQLLCPDSTDPQFQTPFEVGSHDGDEVEITAFVLDFINPATRF